MLFGRIGDFSHHECLGQWLGSERICLCPWVTATPQPSPEPSNVTCHSEDETWNVTPWGLGPAGGGRTEPGARYDACNHTGHIRLYLSAGCLLAGEAEARLDLIRHNDKNGPTVVEKASAAKY